MCLHPEPFIPVLSQAPPPPGEAVHRVHSPALQWQWGLGCMQRSKETHASSQTWDGRKESAKASTKARFWRGPPQSLDGERGVLGKRDLSPQGRAGPVVPSSPAFAPAPCPRALLFRPGNPRRWHSAQPLSTDGKAGIAENRFAGAAGAFSSSLLLWSLISYPSSAVQFFSSFFP